MVVVVCLFACTPTNTIDCGCKIQLLTRHHYHPPPTFGNNNVALLLICKHKIYQSIGKNLKAYSFNSIQIPFII